MPGVKRKYRQIGGSASAKKQYKRRRFTANRNFYKRRNTTSLRNLVSAGYLGIERKFYDTTLISGAVTNPTDATGGMLDPSATIAFTTVTQGDGEQQRDGRQIGCLYLEIFATVRTVVIEGAADAFAPCNFFFACILDTQTNGAQMLPALCYKNLGTSVFTANTPLRNLLSGKRFRVLKQTSFTLTPNAQSTGGSNNFSTNGTSRMFRWFIPLKGLKVNYNAGITETIANSIDNSIHLVGYTDNVTTAVPTISYNARLRFVG